MGLQVKGHRDQAHPKIESGPDGRPAACILAAWVSRIVTCVQELLDLAKARMEVPFEDHGPSMAFFFDRPPEAVPSEEVAGGVASNKRKLVQLGDYEVEADNGNFHAKRRSFTSQRQVGAQKQRRSQCSCDESCDSRASTGCTVAPVPHVTRMAAQLVDST